MKARVLCVFLTAMAAWGAQPDYFPLHPGSQWVYRPEGAAAGSANGSSWLVLEITRSQIFDGRSYALLEGLPEGDFWLRTDDDGSLLCFDPERNEESLWYAFQAPEKRPFKTSVASNCCGTAEVGSRAARYTGPIGDFHYALEVIHQSGSQTGIVRELFLPYVGLVHRVQILPGGGEAAYHLAYARIGEVTSVSEPSLSFSLTLDRAVYFADLMPPVDPRRSIPAMTVRLTLTNTGAPVSLMFSSGQTYDLILRDAKGDVVYRWSEGKFFTAALRSVIFEPGEKNFVAVIPLADREGQPLPPGEYTAEAWLATSGPKGFEAAVGFEIRHTN